MLFSARTIIGSALLHKRRVLLGIIVFAGILLRFSYLENYLWLQQGYDESRDMLVARHVVEQRELIMRGPFASGGKGYILNSPVYFWLLAVFWFFTRSVFGTAILWMVLMSSVIVFIYRATANLFGWKAGLLGAFFAAIHPELIFISRQVHVPYLLALIVSGIAVLMTGARQSLTTISLVIFLLFLGLHLHYAIILVVPFSFLWVIAAWIKLYPRYENKLFLVIPIILGIVCLEIWLLLTYRQIPFDQITFFQLTAVETLMQQRPDFAFAIFNELLWETDKTTVFNSMLFFALAAAGYLTIQKHHPDKRLPYSWILLLCLGAVSLGMMYRGILVPSYLISILPLGIIISTAGLTALWKWHKAVGCIAMAGFLVFFSYKSYYRERKMTPAVSFYNRTRTLAEIIYRDAKDRKAEFELAFLRADRQRPLNPWPTGSIYFTLEQLYGKTLVRIIHEGTNFVPLTTNPSFFYIICDFRMLAPDASLETCNEWMRAAQKNTELWNARLLYVEKPYMLWRLEP